MLFENQIISMNHLQLILLIVLCIFLAVFLVLLVIRIKTWIRLAGIRRRGRKGEQAARKYLIKKGYEIIEQQVSLSCAMLIDQKARKFVLRADYMVRKQGKLGIVEVKSGSEVSKPWQLDTRRQLLEYFYYYDVDFILLFNSRAKVLQEIQFPGLN